MEMYSLAILAFVSFFFALFLTPLCRNLFKRLGVVDHPDGLRKTHATPVPRIGGVPLFLAYLGALGVLLLLPMSSNHIVQTGLPVGLRLFPAVALVFFVGLLDDIRGLKPWQKLACQLLAAGIAIWAGVDVKNVSGLLIPSWLSILVTLIWLVGCTNAFNLIDGIDGLATGAGLFATVTIILGALLSNNVALALATVPLAGALLGFLRYNFNPASIFLGDSGSLTIGFLLGCYGVLWSQKGATILGMTAPLMALAVPLLDTGLSIARRFLRHQPIMSGDAGHIHHRLLARGWTPLKTALILYTACGIAASLSLLASVSKNGYRGVIILVFCAAAWIGVQHLGYVEFGVAGRMFLAGAFRRHLNDHLAFHSFKQALQAAETPEERWAIICESCRKFGFTRVELRWDGRRFEETLVDTNGNAVWFLDIPVAGGGHLRLARCFGESQVPTILVPFAESLHKHACGEGVSPADSAHDRVASVSA
jgi:UDP-GlcNAc:undecaprenyl-phosphate/decaprenyl-phosphate GlcNAc-1-phosphate transferase